MRVRVLRPLSGVIDAVGMSQFVPGLVYDIAPALARYLIDRRDAEEVLASDDVLLIDDVEDVELLEHAAGGVRLLGGAQLPLAAAPDRPRRRKTMNARRGRRR